MMIPIRPENIADEWISSSLPEYVRLINEYIKNNISFQKSGPYCFIPVDEFSAYANSLDKDLVDKLIEKVKILYGNVGWIIWEDEQPSQAQKGRTNKYLTFNSDIWTKEKK